MHCLANFCYVCLEEKDKLLSNINSSLSVNKDILHIIGYLPFNLEWLKTLPIILICEECCLRLRENYQFMEKCLKNSALLQRYMNNLTTTSILSDAGNLAELVVKLNIRHKDIDEERCEIQSEDEVKHKEIGNVSVDFEDSRIKEGIICKQEVVDKSDNSTETIEETENAFVNTEDYFVKEENTWKREEQDDGEEYPMENNCTENMNNESGNDNPHLTNTDSVSSGFAGKQMHATNKDDLNTATNKLYNCSTCSASFVTETHLNVHTRIHTNKKSYDCAICKKHFTQKSYLTIHIRKHTGEKPYKCSTCEKCFARSSILMLHMRTHTDEKPYECAICKEDFKWRTSFEIHMRIHTGKKPYKCSTCLECYTSSSALVAHMRVHTDEKPYECATCKKNYTSSSSLIYHMRTHTGEKPYECATCKKCFTRRSLLVSHMLVHTGEKPYKCSKCSKCFRYKSNIKPHVRNKHSDEEPH